MLEDTIIAISTPPGFGGLGIVRLSGAKALAAAGKIFKPRHRSGRTVPVLRPVFGNIIDPWKRETLDEAFLTYYKAPHSYTREDVVELSCHGSPVVLEETVRLGVRAGARQAHPGEFTLRAYAHGRLDILQAEAVDDLIKATSLAQAGISFRHLSGSLSRRIVRFRDRLVGLIAQIEAGIEFPDENLRLSASGHARTLGAVTSDIESLIASYRAGRILNEGITLAIVGRTNVGKSTLFNALLEEERAIVTPYPGTTRDYLRERISIDGILFHLVDMAGFGKAAHPAEKKGILKGRKVAREADGLLVVLDGSRAENAEDTGLLGMFEGRKRLVVVNKADLPARINLKKIRALSGDAPVLEVSALKEKRIDALRKEIYRTFVPAEGFQEEMILHAREKEVLEDILSALQEGRRLLEEGRSEEIYAEEIRKAVSLAGRMTGEIPADEVVNDIFSRFCVGK